MDASIKDDSKATSAKRANCYNLPMISIRQFAKEKGYYHYFQKEDAIQTLLQILPNSFPEDIIVRSICSFL